jgi:hypothetical protein
MANFLKIWAKLFANCTKLAAIKIWHQVSKGGDINIRI